MKTSEFTEISTEATNDELLNAVKKVRQSVKKGACINITTTELLYQVSYLKFAAFSNNATFLLYIVQV